MASNWHRGLGGWVVEVAAHDEDRSSGSPPIVHPHDGGVDAMSLLFGLNSDNSQQSQQD